MTELKSPASEKRKFALWISKETIEKGERILQRRQLLQRQRVHRKAILFYLGYLSSQEIRTTWPKLSLTVKGIVDESANRMGRLLFKMAVEMAVSENILAAVCEVDQQELKRLRGQCVQEIKRTNGMLSFEGALSWQRDD